MDNRYQHEDPWNVGFYETGRTRPRKRRLGCLAVLLVLTILLTGLVSMLGFLNARIVAWLTEKNDPILLDMEHTQLETDTCPTDPDSGSQVCDPTDAVELNTSPLSVPNIPEAGGISLQEIYNKNIPSVVSVICDTGTGTGVVLSGDGYIVTNCHVVESASTITVLLTDQRECVARLVGADDPTDLAVLKIQAEGLVPAEFGDSAVLEVGDSVAAIGDPLGVELRGTMTNGIVSAINRDVAVEGRTMTLIQTNAALNSGNSGGPLINCYGQVVGINTMKIGVFTDASGVEGIGFAIPSTTVREITNQLISQGYVSGRPSLGITGETLSSFDQYYFRLPAGVYIQSVTGGAGETDQMLPGDVLVRVNDSRITDTTELEIALYDTQAGDTALVTVYRSGQYLQMEVPILEDKG